MMCVNHLPLICDFRVDRLSRLCRAIPLVVMKEVADGESEARKTQPCFWFGTSGWYQFLNLDR